VRATPGQLRMSFEAKDGEAGMFKVCYGPLQGLTDQCLQQLAELQADRDQLLLDSAALATDLGVCATNLQSVVATVAFNVPLASEVQQGLNAKDQAAFDTCLEGLHKVGR
jgi:hypothetical protein